ncbi:SUR7/PalI family-domain-containing protein [Lipomyces japonicus]|uniref:SUR7/PalI family-domain-containing protein n=1 Tax=Lipomyces japonicus TaxID=56871 RepID=UPI0034CD4CD8
MPFTPRAATPLCVLLAIAFGLQLVAVISAPIVEKITLADYQNVKFGVFGYCTSSGCSSVRIGYPSSIVSGGSNEFSLPSNARHSLTNLLIVHPIAAGFTLILFIFSLMAHFHSPANSPRYLFFLIIFCLPTFILALLAFLVDILLFVPHMAWGCWIVLAATVLIAICSLILCTMRRTLSSRKAMRKRIFDGNDGELPGSLRLNQFSYFPPGTQERGTTGLNTEGDREVLIYDNEAKTTNVSEDELSLTRDRSGGSDAHAVSDYSHPVNSTYDEQRQPEYYSQSQESLARDYRYNDASPRLVRGRQGPASENSYGRRGPNLYREQLQVEEGQESRLDAYDEYSQNKPVRSNRGGRPPYAVIAPPSVPGINPNSESHLESFQTARYIPETDDIPMAGTPVNGDGETTPTMEVHLDNTQAATTGNTEDATDLEYVPPRQNWDETNQASEDAQVERPARERMNSADYYDDVAPQFADEMLVGRSYAAYSHTPISTRSPYSESRPLPAQQQQQQYFSAQQQPGRSLRKARPNNYGAHPPPPAPAPDYLQPVPGSPDGSVSSNFTSISQRGVNPRYYQAQQASYRGNNGNRPDRTDMMLRSNPDFEVRVGATAGRNGRQRLPQAPTIMGLTGDSPYAAISRGASSNNIHDHV